MAVLLTGGTGSGHLVTASGSPTSSLAARPAATGPSSRATQPETTLSPVAAATATLAGDLKEGVIDGQVAPQAGQNLFNQLQQLLFQTPGQNSQQVQQQYSQLVQVYAQDKSQGQVTGQAATSLSRAISALGAALGTL